MPLQSGDRLGPYEVQALLRVGGMGEVYRGRDTRLGRTVALKVISPHLVGDASHRLRFDREARAASVLNRPSIVTIYDIGEADGVSWIAMEWVDGQTLRAALANGALPLDTCVGIARDVAAGLAVAHANGVVHRDLKPENIMIAEIKIDRSKGYFDFGYALKRSVFLRGTAAWQRTHGGLRAGSQSGNPFPLPGELNTPERFAQRDRLLRTRFWQLGGGLSYATGPVDVFASVMKYVWGRDAHNGQAYTLGATWYFDISKSIVPRPNRSLGRVTRDRG